MTPDRIGRMSFGGDFVSFVSRYAGGLFAAGLAPVMHVLDWVDADRGYRARKARFDKENPGYLASALRMAGRDDASRSLNGRYAKSCGLPAGAPKRMALFTALRGARRSVGAIDVNKCVTQLHREWTEQVATVCPIASLTGLLQRGSRSAKAGGANRSCGPA